ncbi:ankyrin repeat domain-containing protein [Tenacibaculum piscium]|uniref:ankyrin repeat domain-containing protein n=1 Tax=Tenacibaculum piscium TaxID=1458515 RepID=UPI001F2EEBF6|nr:ankyrin repeat domain-containing protein [Tenacibaculum piscium]MCG8182584.1 ankyrin repeat domain-containing protein [Tenacibaculum piscium]MCG8203976.1 ankyrin repeat domain-containing protein [Tenacibaculum piscium]
MKLLKLPLLFSFCIISSLISAQNSNIFLEKDFWETNPTIEIVEQKIKENNNVTALSSNGFDPVTYAILAKAPNATIKHLLLKKGNPVNKLTHDKRTYIFWAAYKGNTELIKHLIENNARLDLKDSHHFSPLTFAAVAGQTNTEIYDLFIKNGIDIKNDLDEKGANALLLLIGHLKDFKLVNYFTNKGLSLDSKDNNGNGAFNYTAYKGNKAMLELLIKKGLPYKNLSINGDNAILASTIGSRNGYNSLSFIKYLENLGINPNVTNKDGVTPLHNIAYSNKDIEVYNYFLEKGVNVNQVDNNGETPLLKATRRNSLKVVQLLTSKTKNINHTNKNGKSALTNALKNKPEILKFLLEKGADVSVIDTKGNNLNYHLFKTFNQKKKEEFQQKLSLLKTKGLDITENQKNGNTLYHLAVEKQSLAMLDFIKKYSIDINAINKKGLSALQEAVLTAKNDKIIKYLISKGAKKTVRTSFNETLYDLARENEALKNTDISFLK